MLIVPLMKRLSLLLPLVLACATLCAQTKDEAIDFTKARELFQREQRGEKLSAEDQAYLNRAKEQRARGGERPQGAPAGIDFQKAQALRQRAQKGEKLSPEEQEYLNKALAASGQRPQLAQRKAPEHLVPLIDMTAQDRYEGEDGGLYGGGSNTPPPALRQAAEAQLARIQPLDAEGRPAGADGKIVLVSISMSNATQEFSTFKRIADSSPAKGPRLTIVDCAQGGQTMAAWAPPEGRPWGVARSRLTAAGVTTAQVQVAWIKLANAGPAGTLAEHGKRLEADTVAVLHNARTQFPNLRIAYLASRIWAGNATTGLNPEPYAYEGAFPVRWLIQRQMKGDAELAEAKAPLLLWGPYLWAEGSKGRKTDKLTWEKEDFGGDGTHPSPSGQMKVANLLLDFFSTDPLAKSWFASGKK